MLTLNKVKVINIIKMSCDIIGSSEKAGFPPPGRTPWRKWHVRWALILNKWRWTCILGRRKSFSQIVKIFCYRLRLGSPGNRSWDGDLCASVYIYWGIYIGKIFLREKRVGKAELDSRWTTMQLQRKPRWYHGGIWDGNGPSEMSWVEAGAWASVLCSDKSLGMSCLWERRRVPMA